MDFKILTTTLTLYLIIKRVLELTGQLTPENAQQIEPLIINGVIHCLIEESNSDE